MKEFIKSCHVKCKTVTKINKRHRKKQTITLIDFDSIGELIYCLTAETDFSSSFCSPQLPGSIC